MNEAEKRRSRVELEEAERAYDERHPSRKRRKRTTSEAAPGRAARSRPRPGYRFREVADTEPEGQEFDPPVSRVEKQLIVLVLLYGLLWLLYAGLLSGGYGIPSVDQRQVRSVWTGSTWEETVLVDGKWRPIEDAIWDRDGRWKPKPEEEAR